MILINLLLTWFLIGLIWVVQVVHYPTFRFFKEGDFLPFHHFHTKSITKIVVGTMIAELALGAWLTWQQQFSMDYLIPFLMLLGIWASTFFIQIPLHTRLAERRNEKEIERLINSNWIRTVLWTFKGIWLAYIFV